MPSEKAGQGARGEGRSSWMVREAADEMPFEQIPEIQVNHGRQG